LFVHFVTVDVLSTGVLLNTKIQLASLYFVDCFIAVTELYRMNKLLSRITYGVKLQ
jgi:hypothetical protein